MKNTGTYDVESSEILFQEQIGTGTKVNVDGIIFTIMCCTESDEEYILKNEADELITVFRGELYRKIPKGEIFTDKEEFSLEELMREINKL